MLARIRKALIAAAGAGFAAYTTGATDGTVSTADWIVVVGSVIVIGVVTYSVPNAGPKPPEGVNPTGPYVGRN